MHRDLALRPIVRAIWVFIASWAGGVADKLIHRVFANELKVIG